METAPRDGLTPETLLARYFWRHYPADVRADPSRFRHLDANPGGNPALPAALAEAAELFVANAPALLGVALTFDDEGVAALARALDRPRRDAWIASETGAEPGVLFNALVHASAFLGEVIVRRHGGAWEVRRPLWESVVRRRHGGAVSPFHWLLRCLADDAVDDVPLAWRWHVHVVMAGADPSSLPVVTEARRLPSLKAPTYDLLVKYLHQHLPSLRDVGEGFPTAAEFTAKRYASLGFEVLHGGRVLALHGQSPGWIGAPSVAAAPRSSDGSPNPSTGTPSTVEILWLTAHGYDHADVVPADAGVAYFARAVTEELVEVTVAWQGKPVTHRLTFRGHA